MSYNQIAFVPKEGQCIKFSKDGQEEEQQDTVKAPSIELSKVIENDKPYGKCSHKETKDCADKKKNHMLNDDYFSSTINRSHLFDMSRLPEYILVSEEEVKKQLAALFSGPILDSNKVNAVKCSLSSYEKYNTKGTIGPLLPIESLNALVNVSPKTIDQLFNEIKKDVVMTRYILNDGNSFYRAFMLGIFEHNILYFDLYALGKLALGITAKISSKQLNRYEPTVNYSEVVIILHLIISLVNEKKSKAAYDLLLTAFNQSKSFDFALIKYMRIALAEYIETNSQLIFNTENWEEINAIAAPAYLSHHSFDYKGYIRDRVLAMNYEADKFLVQLSPVLFRINLDLYAIEGTANEVKHISYLKQYFHFLKDLSFHNCISVFYSFARYHKLYHKDSIQYHDVNITFRTPKSQQSASRFKVISKNAQCKVCSETSDVIRFNHIPQTDFCKTCLTNAIDHIIRKRITNFIEEYYNNKEFYFRAIAMSERFEEKLEDEDFIELFNRSIAQQILYTMDQLCFQCMKLLGSNYQTMPCQCKLCNICLIDNIMNTSDQKVVLNGYEKANFQLKVVKCACGCNFDTASAVNLVYKSRIDQLTKEADIRLIKTAEVVCSYCGKFHKKANYSQTISMNTNTVKNEYMETVKFTVLNENDHTNCVHIMCKNCLKEVKQDKVNKIHRGELKECSLFYPLSCKVCLKTHQIGEKTLSESKNPGCCFIF